MVQNKRRAPKMPAISVDDYDELKGVRKGTRPVSAEVAIIRDLEIGEGFLFTDEDTEMGNAEDATRLANRLSSYGSKNRANFVLKTKKVNLEGGRMALAVKKMAPNAA
jgi:hypothetical protein